LLGYKKLGGIIIIISLLVGIARIICGLHYPGDILGGLILGIGGSYLLFYLDKYIEKYLAKPLLNIAKKLRLA
jgi:undecaprenyl-diphosphatase